MVIVMIATVIVATFLAPLMTHRVAANRAPTAHSCRAGPRSPRATILHGADPEAEHASRRAGAT